MKKRNYKIIIAILLILLVLLGGFAFKKMHRTGDHKIGDRYTGRDLTLSNTVSSGINVVLPNNRPYIIEISARDFSNKEIRLDVLSGRLDIEVAIVNHGKQKKTSGGDAALISTLTGDAVRPDGTHYELTSKTCLVIGSTSEECEYIINGKDIVVEENDEKVIILIKSEQLYGNPAFNWEIKNK